MLLEEISGCCTSVIPRSPIGLWTTTNPDSVLPSSRMVQPLDHSCQNHFHAASYQLLSPSRFFIPSLLQLTVQHQKKKNYSKLFHYSIISISSKNLFIIYSNRYRLHSIASFFTLLARKRRRISLVFVIKKKKKKRGRRKRTGTLFAYEARSLWRIIVAQAGTYRHDDKEDRFPSAARKNYTRGNTSLVRITGRFPQTSEPDCEPVYFRLRKSRGAKCFCFFFLLPLLPFSHFFIYFLRIDERNLFDRNIVYIDKWNEIDTTRLYQEVDNTFIHLLYTYFFLYLYYFIDRDF